MLNFPVGVGTSGHLMGGTLAAVLVGPWTAVLVLTVVLTVQALVFADGGLTALGTNILLLGIVTVLVGWLVTRMLQRMLPQRPTSVVPASFVGAWLSVVAAAGVFVVLYLLGGAVQLPLGALLGSMLGWHALIGLGEGVITAAVVAAVVASRPDLVYAVRGLRPALQLRDADGVLHPASPQDAVAAPAPHQRSSTRLVAVGAALALLLAGVVSFVASGNPDGLEYVAGQQGFLGSARDHLFGQQPLADYGEVGSIPVGLAGLLGVIVTALVGWLVFRWYARRRPEPVNDDVNASV